METRERKERPFHNVRVRSEIFRLLADHAFNENLNLARCVEEALADWCEKEGIQEAVA